jgi:hypothetical protein
MAAAEVLHEGVTGGNSGGRPDLFQPAHRPQPSLQPSMIAFDRRRSVWPQHSPNWRRPCDRAFLHTRRQPRQAGRNRPGDLGDEGLGRPAREMRLFGHRTRLRWDVCVLVPHHGSFGDPSRDSRRPSAAPAAGRSGRSVAGRLDAERSSGGEPGRGASAAPSPAPRTAGASDRAAPAGVGRPAAAAPPADDATGGSPPPWTPRRE